MKQILFLSGVMIMAINFLGCGLSGRFEKYSSRDPEINVEMDYFSGWTVNEDRGSYGSYAQALFLEPVRKNKSRRAFIDLTIIKESKATFQSATLEGFLADWMKKWQRRKEIRFLSQEKSEILGNPAFVIEMTYEELESPEAVQVSFVPMQEKVILFKRGAGFYALRYVNVSKDFPAYAKQFLHCAGSLRFKK